MPKEFEYLSHTQKNRRIQSMREQMFSNLETVANNNKVQNLNVTAVCSTDLEEDIIVPNYTGNFIKTKEPIIYKDDFANASCSYDSEECAVSNLKKGLRNWSANYNIPQSALTALLNVLNDSLKLCAVHQDPQNCIKLPKDARTLMLTPRNIGSKIINGNGGQIIYFGLENGLKRSIKRYYGNNPPSNIKINLNVDGLPLTRSSASQFWPIFAVIHDPEIKCIEPFPVQIFHGMNKPLNSNDFLQNFVDEFCLLMKNGIKVDNFHILLSINSIICDAPARSFITCIKNHTGYFGCSRCIQEGKYINNRVTFPEINSCLRTDKSFIERQYPEHHRGFSILEITNIGMVSQIPIDYMHLVCLGVMKRLLLFWVKGKMDVRLKHPQKQAISTQLLSIKQFLPTEFQRKPRPIEDIDRWKATELRQFLLYTGPVILKNILEEKFYQHFMALSIAIRILCCKDLHITFNDYSNKLLIWFVKRYSKLYGKEYITYNVHNLIHLAADVKTFGQTLDNFSAFYFENEMFKIKKKLKDSRYPLQQIANRLEEKYLLGNSYKEPIFPHVTYSKKKKSVITSVTLKDYKLSKKSSDNCIQLNDSSVCLINSFDMIGGNIIIYIKKYKNVQSYFLEPCNSDVFRIFKIANDDVEELSIGLEQIKQKCFRVPFQNTFVIMPLLH